MEIEQLKIISEKLVNNSLESGHADFEQRLLYKLTESDRSAIVIGPRRIGKTTLLEALARKTTRDKMDAKVDVIADLSDTSSVDANENPISTTVTQYFKAPARIMFLKLDSLEFATLTPKDWNEVSIMIRDLIANDKYELVLFDEIQSMPNWSIFIKDIKDSSKHDLRIVCTGSNSNALVSGSEHGVGRYDILFFGVLTFAESIQKNLSMDPLGKTIDMETLQNYIEYNHFPVYDRQQYKAEVPAAIVEKSFSATKKNKTALFKLFKYIATKPGSQANASKISSETGITRKLIDEYLSELQDAQMIFKLANNHKLSQQNKVFSLIPGAFTLFDASAKFNKTMLEETQGEHFENFVFIQLLSFTRTLGERMNWTYLNDKDKSLSKNEIDFVFQETHGYEVKRTLPTNENEYLGIAKKHGIKKVTFIYMLGDKKEQKEVEGIIFDFIRFDEFNDPETTIKIKEDLNVYW